MVTEMALKTSLLVWMEQWWEGALWGETRKDFSTYLFSFPVGSYRCQLLSPQILGEGHPLDTLSPHLCDRKAEFKGGQHLRLLRPPSPVMPVSPAVPFLSTAASSSAIAVAPPSSARGDLFSISLPLSLKRQVYVLLCYRWAMWLTTDWQKKFLDHRRKKKKMNKNRDSWEQKEKLFCWLPKKCLLVHWRITWWLHH